MEKEKVKGRTEEQFVCPNCAKAIEYKDTAKYKRGLPAGLMEMSFYEFLKQKTGVYKDGKREAEGQRLANLCSTLRYGKLYKEYEDLPNDRYRVQWHEKKIEKVKDLYSLTEREIYGIRNMGKITWDKLNTLLKDNNLAPLTLPYQYTVNYPLKKDKKKSKN